MVDHSHPWLFGSLDSKLFNQCFKHRPAFAPGASAGRIIECVYFVKSDPGVYCLQIIDVRI